MTSIFYQNWLEKQHDSLLFNKAINGHKQKAKSKKRESGCDTEILFSVHMV
ncbi:hypothetical protein [Symbiopectobacterium sp. RP]|uniref:hypothetical protein n=1 Tax=Symbiopectobacterium sp. RP TaxID=3248553 RepID=UPI003D2E5A84